MNATPPRLPLSGRRARKAATSRITRPGARFEGYLAPDRPHAGAYDEMFAADAARQADAAGQGERGQQGERFESGSTGHDVTPSSSYSASSRILPFGRITCIRGIN